MHDNLTCTLYVGGKMPYWHYDPKSTLFTWERKMQYLHDNLNMYTISGWQNVMLPL
jgi:hypothetical protein